VGTVTAGAIDDFSWQELAVLLCNKKAGGESVNEPIKRSDAIEQEYTQAVLYGIVGLVALGLTFLFWRYGGMFYSFSWGFGLVWLGAWGYAVWSYYKTTRVPAHPVKCPFCHKATVLVAPPQMDFTCEHCLKRVPIENGCVLEVIAVKCPHCGSMEQVSVKATAAICEQCQREFPVRVTGRVPVGMPLPQDDPTPYELVLLGVDRHKEEQAILALERLLDLNRPDVKKLLESAPVVLLTNLSRRKAESYVRELSEQGVKIEARRIEDPNRVPTPWN
jgi:ribosomal protein L7/L12